LQEAVAVASRCVGLSGLIGGQWLDMKEGRPTPAGFVEIIDRKTGDLFVLCFVLGWLFGGGDIAELPRVRQMAMHFGRAFQLVDDIDDLQQDLAGGKEVNSAILFGEKETLRLVVEHVDRFCALAAALGLEQTPLIPLAQTLALAGSRQ
jgi:geranylgeranyl pyrophosphate synthase